MLKPFVMLVVKTRTLACHGRLAQQCFSSGVELLPDEPAAAPNFFLGLSAHQACPSMPQVPPDCNLRDPCSLSVADFLQGDRRGRTNEVGRVVGGEMLESLGSRICSRSDGAQGCHRRAARVFVGAGEQRG